MAGSGFRSPEKASLQGVPYGAAMMIKLTGFDQLARKLDEAAKAVAALEGEIASVKFDPIDPISIERAIEEMYARIDAKIEPWAANPLVAQLVDGLKERCREGILERAANARLGVVNNDGR